MADPIARPTRIRQSPGKVAFKFAARLILPTIITGMMTAPIATAGTPRVVPLGCGVTWTRVGGAFIASPGVCPQEPPASQPSPAAPAPRPRDGAVKDAQSTDVQSKKVQAKAKAAARTR